jgi:hypothetical protein
VALVLVVCGTSACDQGHQDDRSAAIGSQVHIVSANVGVATPLPITRKDGITPATIELAFDQLLLPSCIARQTFQLNELVGSTANLLEPSPAYDPVARVVSLTPMSPLTAGQTYRLVIATPQNPTDTNGLRSIGGATMDLSGQQPDVDCPPGGYCITFLATNGTQPDAPTPHTVDFCNDIFLPILAPSCGTSSCHGGSLPALGLALNSSAGITTTAINRIAEGANTGPLAAPYSPPGLIFGINTPIIDPGTGAPAGGNPSDSWLIYKLLLAPPSPCPAGSNVDAGPDGGTDAATCNPSAAPTVPSTYGVAWQPLSDDARTTLGNLVQGFYMPYPPGMSLTLDQLEAVSFWIQEGAPVAQCQ